MRARNSNWLHSTSLDHPPQCAKTASLRLGVAPRAPRRLSSPAVDPDPIRLRPREMPPASLAPLPCPDKVTSIRLITRTRMRSSLVHDSREAYSGGQEGATIKERPFRNFRLSHISISYDDQSDQAIITCTVLDSRQARAAAADGHGRNEVS